MTATVGGTSSVQADTSSIPGYKILQGNGVAHFALTLSSGLVTQFGGTNAHTLFIYRWGTSSTVNVRPIVFHNGRGTLGLVHMVGAQITSTNAQYSRGSGTISNYNAAYTGTNTVKIQQRATYAGSGTNQLTLHINGSLVTTTTSAVSPSSLGSLTLCGNETTDGNIISSTTAKIMSVRAYNQILTAAQCTTIETEMRAEYGF